MLKKKNIVFEKNMRIHRPYIIHISQNADLRPDFTDNLFYQVFYYLSQVRKVGLRTSIWGHESSMNTYFFK